MTGIEQLRKLGADAVRGGEVGRAICDIADQIERERECDADTIENLRLELGEARDDAAWVREHGGLDAVKRRWECLSYYADPVPRSCMEKLLARLQRQIDESHAALRRRRGIISELNRRATDLTRENAELRKRAMPEGMEWPRYESGEIVQIGDDVVERFGDDPIKVRSVEFRDGATYLREGFRTDGIVIVRPGERVKRPAPKVLAGDNEPLYRGEYVWHEDGTKLMVLDFLHEEDDETIVKVSRVSGPTNWSECRSLSLTHERPDSWERIEEDAEGIRQDIAMYLGDYSQSDFEEPGDSVQSRVIDLVRRAKALAERERGE